MSALCKEEIEKWKKIGKLASKWVAFLGSFFYSKLIIYHL